MPPKGRIVVDETYCKGCELCVGACPQEVLALSIVRITPKGYHPVELVGQSCTGCGICTIVCPEAALSVFRETVRVQVS
jgi:2-oxoglutarate ferredoxin oxidoreductase subunit delta